MESPKDKANQKIRLILNKLLEEYELGPGFGDIKLGTKNFLCDTDVDDNQFIRILNGLKQKSIIESSIVHGNVMDNDDLICFIKTPASFKVMAEDYIKTLSGIELQTETSLGSIIYLEKNGDLWHGDKNKFCYSMSATKNRLAIIKKLVENKDYQTTESLAHTLNKTSQNLRNEINKIKVKIKTRLDLDDFIESIPGLGYKINQKYQIKIVK